MTDTQHYESDLAIIGTGLAGLAASVFAVNKGLCTALVGSTGGLAFTTGYLDLLGISPKAANDFLATPHEGLQALRTAWPEHPYAHVSDEEIAAAFQEFTRFLSAAGLPYTIGNTNLLGVSPVGTLKATYAAPDTMASGMKALAARTPCLLVDFIGLKAFSAKEMAVNLNHVWPQLRPVSVHFPGLEWSSELYPEAMARSLEVPETRKALADTIRPHLGDAQCVGLPAVLGIHGSAAVQQDLAAQLGVPVFEVPTLPPGVPGIRLRECLDDALRSKGLTQFAQRYVFNVERDDSGFTLSIGESVPEYTLRAKGVILATGRFLSGGLYADREKGILEPLMGLPVASPANRDDWHAEDYFAREGHPINRSGIRVDESFRPVGTNGQAIHPNLFAAGTILAGQDWIREKSGAGIALASAWKAVAAFAQNKN